MANLKTYEVEISAKCSWNAPGTITVCAKNAADAKSQARREMSNRGYTRQDGPFTYTATVAQ